MTTQKYSDLNLDLQGEVAVVSLRRPIKRNALNDGLILALRDLFQSDPRWSEVGIAKELAGLPRVIKARWKP